ncbi:MAG: hypothetical protein K0V04_14615, partial [Deltaproteobacteria bacterium]|nr:hypothetical protein [Deltaproteobacteria bacterium]
APPRYWWWGVAAAVVIASVAVLGWRGRATQLDGPNPDAAADRATRERGATARQGAPSSASGTARPSLPTAPQPQPAPPSPSPGSPAGAAVMPPPATTPSRPSQGLRRPGPRRATPTNPTGPGEPPSGELSLGRELAAIDAVNAALRTNDLKQAAAALARYEQEFPRGQLRAEARALRIIVDCRRGASGAHVAAERFQRREPNSVLAERVTAACNRAAP